VGTSQMQSYVEGRQAMKKVKVSAGRRLKTMGGTYQVQKATGKANRKKLGNLLDIREERRTAKAHRAPSRKVTPDKEVSRVKKRQKKKNFAVF